MRQLAIHLVIHRNELAQAALQEQFAKHYADERDEQKALQTIDTALATYKRHGSMAAYGRALNTKGVMKKRFGHAPGETLRVHREAIRILRTAGDRRGEAEALGDLGAVLLENERGKKTVFWWRKSMERLQGSLDYPALCSHLTDYSYICALYQPDDAETETHLEAAHALARRLGLTHLTCRTSINLANYLMMHSAPSGVARCGTLLADALRLACADGDTYLELLVTFSRIVLDHRIGRASDVNVIDRFFQLVSEECVPAWKDVRSADKRLIHIGRYLAIHQPARLVPAQIESPLLRSFLSIDSIETADLRETENPYYCAGGFYATYY